MRVIQAALIATVAVAVEEEGKPVVPDFYLDEDKQCSDYWMVGGK